MKPAGSPEFLRSLSIKRESNTPISDPLASTNFPPNSNARISTSKAAAPSKPRLILETLLIQLAVPRLD